MNRNFNTGKFLFPQELKTKVYYLSAADEYSASIQILNALDQCDHIWNLLDFGQLFKAFGNN